MLRLAQACRTRTQLETQFPHPRMQSRGPAPLRCVARHDSSAPETVQKVHNRKRNADLCDDDKCCATLPPNATRVFCSRFGREKREVRPDRINLVGSDVVASRCEGPMATFEENERVNVLSAPGRGDV